MVKIGEEKLKKEKFFVFLYFLSLGFYKKYYDKNNQIFRIINSTDSKKIEKVKIFLEKNRKKKLKMLYIT